MEFREEILRTIDHYDMFKAGERVLVGVSGGPDSVCLLHVLSDLEEKLGIHLFVAHLDHGMRGKDSREDAKFVKDLADKMRVRSILGRISKSRADSKLSPEENLRMSRYSFFARAAREVRAGVIVTAHTLDDQAETVLMRIIKGASLKGVVGIHPVRIEGKLRLVRPLVEIEKVSVLEYLKERGIPYRIDRTNAEDKFFRNKIRNRVLPYLGKLNPRIKRALFNLAESLREDFEFIELEKRRRMSIKRGKRSQNLLLKDLLLQPKAMQKELVRETLKLLGANIKKLSYRHWKDVDTLLRKKAKGKSIDLPGKVRVVKEARFLAFKRTI
ncbi:MAG: tRNA lysidine(34) synthetase TilS [Candidatus Omnitrophota bacterium]